MCAIVGCSRKVVNSHFKLCDIHNQERLKASKTSKIDRVCYTIDKGKKPIRIKEKGKNKENRGSLFVNDNVKVKITSNNLIKDEEFYLECFNLSDHKCEECGCDLPTNFRNADGKVEARYRYSHIIPKSIAPELRHNVDNINHLCLVDHQEWENGNKVGMKIFAKNLEKFPNFLNRLVINKL
jgi:hypothetical protein